MIEKQDKTSKHTSDHQTTQSIQSKQKHTWVTGKEIVLEKQPETRLPEGEHVVMGLRNPTEDKRAFLRMLTSADLEQTGHQFCAAAHGKLVLPWRLFIAGWASLLKVKKYLFLFAVLFSLKQLSITHQHFASVRSTFFVVWSRKSCLIA